MHLFSGSLAASAHPTPPPSAEARVRTRGFTLLEILLTIALIGLLASVLVSGAAGLLNNKPMTADEVFWSAVQEARKSALQGEQTTALRFVDDREKGKGFSLTGNSVNKFFPIPQAGDIEVTFLSQQKGNSLIMVAGTVLETQKIEAVTFYGDGTCTPFRVQYYRNGAARVITVDPWTCAPILTPADSSATGFMR